ncbi:g5380 [Coccomyxa elongata]
MHPVQEQLDDPLDHQDCHGEPHAHCPDSQDAAHSSGSDEARDGEGTSQQPSQPQPAQSTNSRPCSKYSSAGFVGYWASFGSGTDVERPSVAELEGRMPGRDGSEAVNCTLDPTTGDAVCQEDQDAVDAVNKFLAEELARACRFNKSHSCFTADLQAFRSSEHVEKAMKDGLKGLDTYAKVLRQLERDDGMFRDHFDGTVWREKFCKDPLIARNGGPDKNVGLEFCADGVNPYKRKSYSMWFGALSILNLPPAARHSVDTMHICFIVPGPKKPSDFFPYLDIVTDELNFLYWEGVPVRRAGWESECTLTVPKSSTQATGNGCQPTIGPYAKRVAASMVNS